MLSLLKGFAVFVVATLGTTAIIGHAPRAAHVRHQVPTSSNVTTDSASVLDAERYLLRPRTPAYVPPPAETVASESAPAPAPAQIQAPAAAPGTGQAAAAVPASVPAPVPAPPIAIGSAQQALINADRAAAGLPALSWSGCLAAVAAGQDAAMVSAGRIFHGSGVSQDFGCSLGSSQTGENVGYWSSGLNDAQLNVMFMNSPEHRANIMGPYRFVGTAWRVAPNGFGYISVEFG